jgi:hypothetical protein
MARAHLNRTARSAGSAAAARDLKNKTGSSSEEPSGAAMSLLGATTESSSFEWCPPVTMKAPTTGPLGHPKDHIAASRTPMFAATESPVSMAHKMGTMERCAGPPRQAGGCRRTGPTRNSIGIGGGSDATLTPSHLLSNGGTRSHERFGRAFVVYSSSPEAILDPIQAFCGTQHRAVRFGARSASLAPSGAAYRLCLATTIP